MYKGYFYYTDQLSANPYDDNPPDYFDVYPDECPPSNAIPPSSSKPVEVVRPVQLSTNDVPPAAVYHSAVDTSPSPAADIPIETDTHHNTIQVISYSDHNN